MKRIGLASCGAVAGFTLLAMALLGPTPVLGAETGRVRITPEGMAQIAALQAEKESRTPAQRKIDSNILYEIRKRRSGEAVPGVPSLTTGLAVDDHGVLAVDIRAHVTDALLNRLAALEASILDLSPAYRSVAARLPLSEIEALAEMDEVIFIQPHSSASFGRDREKTADDPRAAAPQPRVRPTFEERAQRVRTYLESAVLPMSVGSQSTEGDTTHQANTARSTIGPSGAGVKIGVISEGAVTSHFSQASGDLPANLIILPGQMGSEGPFEDEGTAMLEVVYDLAPQAQLYFAAASPTIGKFAQTIRDLRALGCDIIIDDALHPAESPFQDGQAPSIISNTNGGVVTQAVRDVVAAGAMYFASAGNFGNAADGTSSVYEGDWVDGGALAPLVTGNVHNFGGGAQSDLIQTGAGTAWPIGLFWSDPLGGSSNDYDLYIFDNTLTTVVTSSTNVQSGTQDPYEQVAGIHNVTGNRIVVLKKASAAARFFHVTLNSNGAGVLAVGTAGAIRGHGMAAGAFSVAATPAAAPGPFPAAHSGANVSETFSADGPRRIFFDANGTAFTPGNFSSTGGIVRPKPDITAADRVDITGFWQFPVPFVGTAAATSHAAAIAALLKSALPSPTNAQIRTALLSTAIDIEAAGTDSVTGAGIVMPLPALAALGIGAQASISQGAITVGELVGNSDGDGIVEKGETGTLVIANLVNSGVTAATGVTATLSSATPGITILAPAGLPYPTLTAGGGTASNPTAYKFFLSPASNCGQSVDFVLTVTYNDGAARTKVLPFTASLADGFTLVGEVMDATPPPAHPKYVASTGTQTGRVSRTETSSSCGFPKPFPGVIAGDTPLYDAYTFTATNSGCTSVTLNAPVASGGIEAFVAVYSPAFVPASINTNYVADSGSSSAAARLIGLTFNANAGQQYVVVVSEVPGAAPSPLYTLTVTGAPLTSCNFAPGAPQADLAITKTDGATTAVPGGSTTYTIVATNNGPNSVTGATVSDTFPASLTATWTCVGAFSGTCTASGAGNLNDTVNLPVGASVTYTVNATISVAATGTLVNTATVAVPGGATDPTPGNNSATDTDTLTPQANLSITKTDGVTTAVPGGSVTYTIVASNAGPSNASGSTVADTFPASLTATWTCAGAGGGTCTAAGAGTINDTVNLPVGASVTYTVTAAISAAATGSLVNTATVTAPGGVTDPVPGNNSATDTDTLGPQANLAITKTDGVATATPGGSVTYTIIASNAGPSSAPGSTVADTFPASLTATWTCAGAGGGTCTGIGSRQHQRHGQPAGGGQRHLHGERDDQRGGHGFPGEHGDRDRARWGDGSGAREQLGHGHGHPGGERGPFDHEDGRRDHGHPGRERDLHDRGEQQRPEQRDERDGGGHVPRVLDRRPGRARAREGERAPHREPATSTTRSTCRWAAASPTR